MRINADPILSPTLLIHPDCKVLLRALPTLIADETQPDDCLDTVEAYPANGVRFLAMSRPSAPWTDPPELPAGAIGHDINALRDEIAAGV
jgi:hypothetical protein